VDGPWFFSNTPARGIFRDLLSLHGIVALAIGLCDIDGVRLSLRTLRRDNYIQIAENGATFMHKRGFGNNWEAQAHSSWSQI
jgi:hypothetical protein